jgi:tetratricopeptide (TPR) repeat protein
VQADQWVRRAESILWEDYQTGRWEKGLQGVRSIQAQLSEPDGRLALLEGVFEEMIGSYEDAIERYEQALDSGATLSTAQVSPVSNRLCTLLIRKALSRYEEGDYEACLESLRRADRAVPGRRDIAFDLGCVYLRLRNPNGALQAFSRYMELEKEPTPRRVLTGDAIVLLQRQLSRSPVVRYDGQDIAVDLIFERPVSLGNLLAGESGSGPAGNREELLDSVMLAPYLELAVGKEGDESSVLAVWD